MADFLISSGGCPIAGNLHNMHIPYREEDFQPTPFDRFIQCPHPDKRVLYPRPGADDCRVVSSPNPPVDLVWHYEKLVERLEREIERLTAELEKERASHGSL